MNLDKRLVWTPYPFPRGLAEADLWDGLYLAFRASHGTAIKSGIPMVGYVAFGEPTWISLFLQALGGRCFSHVTGGELFLGQLHIYNLIHRTWGACEPE